MDQLTEMPMAPEMESPTAGAPEAAPTPARPREATNAAIRAIRAARQAAPVPAPAPAAPKRAPWVRAVLHVVRRSHLYAGLFLLPWVFLYGVTGLLFNHPTWFSDQDILTFGEAELRGTALETPTTPADLAGRVVAALNDAHAGRFTLVEPDAASLGRGGLSVSLTAADGTAHTLSLKSNGMGGTIRSTPGGDATRLGTAPAEGVPARGEGPATTPSHDAAGPGGGRTRSVAPGETGRPAADGERSDRGAAREEAPFAVRRGLTVDGSPVERLEAALPTILERVGLAGAEVGPVRMAPLSFALHDGSRTWSAQYDAASGSLSAEPRAAAASADRSSLSFRRYLLNLHKSRGYPEDEVNVRSVWAGFVDAMSLIMVFWGVSGVVMWWQIKKTHRAGTATLALSLALALWIGFEMYNSMGPR